MYLLLMSSVHLAILSFLLFPEPILINIGIAFSDLLDDNFATEAFEVFKDVTKRCTDESMFVFVWS